VVCCRSPVTPVSPTSAHIRTLGSGLGRFGGFSRGDGGGAIGIGLKLSLFFRTRNVDLHIDIDLRMQRDAHIVEPERL
jgi:hypothetical protein